MPLKRETTSIDDEFGAFVNAPLDPTFDTCFVRGVDDGAVMRVSVG